MCSTSRKMFWCLFFLLWVKRLMLMKKESLTLKDDWKDMFFFVIQSLLNVLILKVNCLVDCLEILQNIMFEWSWEEMKTSKLFEAFSPSTLSPETVPGYFFHSELNLCNFKLKTFQFSTMFVFILINASKSFWNECV